MTDADRDQAANQWAHRHRWLVWGLWPAVLAVLVLTILL